MSNTNITEATPRTDKLTTIVQDQTWGYRDMQLLAQQLERELNAAKAEVERLQSQLSTLKKDEWETLLIECLYFVERARADYQTLSIRFDISKELESAQKLFDKLKPVYDQIQRSEIKPQEDK